MSMRDYAVNEYGLVLNTNHLQILAARILDDYSDEGWEIDKYGIVDELTYKSCVNYIGDFCGEAFTIKDSGETDFMNSEPYNSDTIYYIPILNYPTLLKSAYNSIEEIVSEYKERIGNYLPDNFDYRSNIKHIVGTYFG